MQITINTVRLTLQPDPPADSCLPVHHGATLVFMSISKPLRLQGWLDQAHSQLVSISELERVVWLGIRA